MTLPQSFLEDLKSRLRVSDVVARKVKLIRRGREFVGLSPFSNEKSPSFTVNDDKQFWHCFSSGQTGDVIKFLEKTEGLGFIEAVRQLAGEAGMEMPARDPKSEERERAAASLVDVVEMAQAFYRATLYTERPEHLTAASLARLYLAERGLTPETMTAFGLGYAPKTPDALSIHLLSRGVPVALQVEAGLVTVNEDGKNPRDRFRHRIMFPITGMRGRVVGFGGRALDSDALAKYLNSPDSAIFHKGRLLYNFTRARQPAFDAGKVIAVEGYMDVIALAQAGFANVVAPLGTAMTPEQLALLWRLSPEPVLCFDGDRAGFAATGRTAEKALPLLKPGHSLRFVTMPDGTDPDQLVRETGPALMRVLLDDAMPLSDVIWEKERVAFGWETPEQRAAFEARVFALAASIPDQLVRTHYQQFFKDKCFAAFRGARSRGKAPEARGYFNRPANIEAGLQRLEMAKPPAEREPGEEG